MGVYQVNVVYDEIQYQIMRLVFTICRQVIKKVFEEHMSPTLALIVECG